MVMAFIAPQVAAVSDVLGSLMVPSTGSQVTFKDVYRGYASARLQTRKAILPISEFLDPLIDYCEAGGIEIAVDNGDVRLLGVDFRDSDFQYLIAAE
jgi:hypothetical protein